jgi:hypothetical protein
MQTEFIFKKLSNKKAQKAILTISKNLDRGFRNIWDVQNVQKKVEHSDATRYRNIRLLSANIASEKYENSFFSSPQTECICKKLSNKKAQKAILTISKNLDRSFRNIWDVQNVQKKFEHSDATRYRNTRFLSENISSEKYVNFFFSSPRQNSSLKNLTNKKAQKAILTISKNLDRGFRNIWDVQNVQNKFEHSDATRYRNIRLLCANIASEK